MLGLFRPKHERKIVQYCIDLYQSLQVRCLSVIRLPQARVVRTQHVLNTVVLRGQGEVENDLSFNLFSYICISYSELSMILNIQNLPDTDRPLTAMAVQDRTLPAMAVKNRCACHGISVKQKCDRTGSESRVMLIF